MSTPAQSMSPAFFVEMYQMIAEINERTLKLEEALMLSGGEDLFGPDEIVYASQLANISGLTGQTIGRWHKEGRLPPPIEEPGIGRRLRWRWEDVRPYFESYIRSYAAQRRKGKK